MTPALLSVKDLAKSFHGVAALNGISFTVGRGEIVALIGPNGAGKTTVLNLISGLETADSGDIKFNGRKISGIAAHRIARLGIARTYQASQILAQLNVVENVMVGRNHATHAPFCLAGFWPPFIYREEHRNRTRSYEILEFIGLYEKADRRIDQISYREQKLVELGRCLAMEPALLLLDEPFGGLNAEEISGMVERIQKIRATGVAVVLIDHHFETVFDLADQVVVLDYGEVVTCGRPQDIQENENVKRTYLNL